MVAREDFEFRDGLYGLLTWGGAIVLAGVVALGAALLSGAAAPTANAANGSAVGSTLLAVELDHLFRSERPAGDPDAMFRRDEASRILLTAGGHRGVASEDRDYLIGVVKDRTGVSKTEAEARTDRAIAESRDAITKARHAAVLEAFMVAAALLLGAAVAWFSACEGGRERELDTVPRWEWTMRRRSATGIR